MLVIHGQELRLQSGSWYRRIETVKVEVLTSESAILGGAVIQLSNWETAAELVEAESQWFASIIHSMFFAR